MSDKRNTISILHSTQEPELWSWIVKMREWKTWEVRKVVEFWVGYELPPLEGGLEGVEWEWIRQVWNEDV